MAGLPAGQGEIILKLELLLRHRHDEIALGGLQPLLHPVPLSHPAGDGQQVGLVHPQAHLILHPHQHLAGVDRFRLRRPHPGQGDDLAAGQDAVLIDAALKIQSDGQAAQGVRPVRQVQDAAIDAASQGYRVLQRLFGIQAADGRGIQQVGDVGTAVRYDHLHALFPADRGMEHQAMIGQRSFVQFKIQMLPLLFPGHRQGSGFDSIRRVCANKLW